MALALKGRKSSSSSSRKATRHDDSLFGQDTVELLLAVSEGPIVGLVDGAASFRVGDVPLLDKGTQTPNISNFELRSLKGTNPADSIRLNLGGLSSTKNVGLELRVEGQSIVTQGDKTQIDYLDIRFVVQRLLAVSKEGGEFPTGLDFKVEVKPRSSAVWQIPFDNEPPPPVENTSGASNYRPGTTTPGTVVNDTYREVYLAPSTQPPTTAQAAGAMWFQTDTTGWEPRIWLGSWQAPSGLRREDVAGYITWLWIDEGGGQRRAWYAPDGAAPPRDLIGPGDFLVTPQAGEEVYSYNETSWVGAQDFATPTPAAPGVLSIYGLTRSQYPKEYRIPVARINEPYDVRVTRLSAKSTKDIFADIVFESIQEVKRDVVSFPDLAVDWLTIKATDTFTQIPEFTGVRRGLIIPVPSNHVWNEAEKISEFPGIWDGTFKLAYTNNPSWHAYNFIRNSRYGKNAYFPEVPDQWDFYEFGKHCSAHKFRFNEYIQDPRSINELINYIVGIAGGRYVDRGDGYSTVIWDADDQVARAIFAPENTIEGDFTYSFTDAAERKNDFKVSFKNPELNYREDRVRVWDQNTIDVLGRNAEEFVAVGCRDAEEAVRRGRLRLATALSEKIIVSFKTNRLGRYLLPFEIVLVADDKSSNVISGRIKNPEPLPIGSVRLPLRDQVYLEAGVSYSIQTNVSDGNGGLKIVSYPLTVAVPGLQSELVLSRALEETLPEYAVFTIGAPKPFRITSITPADDEPDQVEITAIEVNRLKWAFVDGLVELRDLVALQTGALSKFVYPVTGAKVVPEITTSGALNFILTWNPTETKLNRGYRIYQSINRQPMQLVGEPVETFFRVTDVQPATYIWSIVAVGLDGTTESAPVTVSYVVSNDTSIRSVGAPTNLRLVDEPEAPIFRARDPRFTWDAATDPLVSKYLVEVLNGSNVVVYSERVEGQLLFTFPLALNQSVNGGNAIRSFTVRVRSIDSTGSFSDPATLVVSHPAPAKLSFETSAVSETIFVQYQQPAGDFQGVLVWMEEVSGFDPLAKAPKYDGANTFIPLPAKAETTYYLRAAAYDSYGKTGLNISDEKVQRATIQLFDPSAPTIPGTPALTTEAVTAQDGPVTAVVRATWAASTGNFANLYEVAVSEAGGSEVVFRVNGTSWEAHGFRPNITVTVRVRAVAKTGFTASGYSPLATITTAKSAVVPANPTGVTAIGTYQGVTVQWTPPTAKDIAYVEVWSLDGVSAAASPPNGATMRKWAAPSATFFDGNVPTSGQRTYWLRAVSTSDVFAAGFTAPVTATQPQIIAAQLAAGIVDATKFASDISVTKVVSALPTTKVSDYVTLTTDGKLYRWNGTAYSAAVASTDISGTITDAQIASIAAAKVAGTLADNQIAALSSNKLVGQIVASQVASVNAAAIAGQLTDSQLAALSAAKITGTLTDAQIAGLSAAKLAGQITTTQIGDSQITTAKIGAAQVLAGNLAAGAVTASKLSIGSVAGGNLCLNGDMEESDPVTGKPSNWTQSSAGGSSTNWYTEPVGGWGGSKGLTLDRGAASESTTNYVGVHTAASMNVVGGQSYECSCYVRGSTASGAGFYLRVKWYSPTGGDLGFSDAVPNGAVATTAAQRSATVTAPAGATLARIELINWQTSTCRWITVDQVVLRPTVGITTIADGAIITSKVAANSIVASKLGISSANLAYNANPIINTRGFQAYSSGGTASTAGAMQIDTTYAPTGFGRAYTTVQTGPLPAGGSIYVENQNIKTDGTADLYRVTGGKRYEFSAAYAGNFQSVYAQIIWCDANGAYVTENEGPVSPYNQGGGIGPGVATYSRVGVFATAPAGASRAYLRIRGTNTAATPVGYSLGMTAVMFAECFDNQVEYSPYTPPGTTIIGGGTIITGSIQANCLVASSITTTYLNVAQIFADSVVVNTLTTSLLTADKITATMLSANAVQARNVAAGAITAGKLVLADTSNMLPNGEFLNGSAETWILGGDAWIETAGATDPGGTWRARGTNDYNGAIGPWLQASPNEVFTVSGMTYNTRSAGSSGFYVQCVDQNGAGVVTYWVAYTATKNAWIKVTGQFTMPANTQKFRVICYADNPGSGTTTYWGKVSCRRAADTLLIVDGAIKAAKIDAAEIFGNSGVFNSLKAGIASFGGLTADQIAAGAITTAKIGVGLGLGNLLAGSDGNGPNIWTTSYNEWPNVVTAQGRALATDWCPIGMRAAVVNTGGPVPAGKVTDIMIQRRLANGNLDTRHPVVPGQRYEAFVYTSNHRCQSQIYLAWHDSAGNYLGVNAVGPYIGDNNAGGQGQPLTSYNRNFVIGTAPSNAHYVAVTMRANASGGDSPYMFAFAWYLAKALPNQVEPSPYTPQSSTVIDGGQVATNTLYASSIVAGSITSDRFTGNTIDAGILTTGSLYTRVLQTGALTADNISVGNGSITSLINGSNTTKINGGAIQANSILANSLKVGSRNIQLVEVSFYAERDGNGNITGVFRWTGGYVLVHNNSGSPQAFQIPASAVSIDTGYYYVWWNITSPANLNIAKDNWPDILNDSNCVLIATVSGRTGIATMVGGTIIDGTRIVTRSIQADQIAANAIQAIHIAANSINGDRITAGTLVADKIASGTLTAGIINVGNDRFTISGTDRRIRIFNSYNSCEHVTLGYLGGHTGDGNDYGMILRDMTNTEVARIGTQGVWLRGNIILDGTVIAGKLAAGAVNASSILAGNIIVTGHIQSNQITQSASQLLGGQNAAYAGLTMRAGSYVNIWAGSNGKPGNAIAPPGQLERNIIIEYTVDGTNWGEIYQIVGCTSYNPVNGVTAAYLQPTYFGYRFAPNWGATAVTFRVRDLSQRYGDMTCYIMVTEHAR